MKKILTLLAVAFATIGASAQTLPGLADIIKTQPEGTFHKDLNHYFEGAYVNKSDGFIYDHLATATCRTSLRLPTVACT